MKQKDHAFIPLYVLGLIGFIVYIPYRLIRDALKRSPPNGG